ncbi:MAG: hypothetical protein AB8F74_01085, partial [Saprospiraceae bacterium]
MKKINESNQTDTNSLINSNYSTKKSEYDDVLFKRDPNFLEMLLKEFSFELKKIKKPKERVRLENDITNYLWEESTFEINSHNVLLLEKIEFMTGDILATTLRGLRRNITEY